MSIWVIFVVGLFVTSLTGGGSTTLLKSSAALGKNPKNTCRESTGLASMERNLARLPEEPACVALNNSGM